MEASWSGSAKIQDGTYAGENAEANTIYAAGANWADTFQVGDAVAISGCTIHESNNQTIIIREIDGDYLRFYENSFTINSGGDTETLTIAREMPELDFICENENRLWGCKGDTVYASKLGDPVQLECVRRAFHGQLCGGCGQRRGLYRLLQLPGIPLYVQRGEHLQGLRGQAPATTR